MATITAADASAPTTPRRDPRARLRDALGPLLPLARRVRLDMRYHRARLAAAAGERSGRRLGAPPVFIIGCGRSGTTILGDLLARHPGVRYLFEPYHLWTAIDPRTDMTRLFQRGPAACALAVEDATPRIARRFSALFAGLDEGGRKTLIEKTPINALRIGYLESLAPGCRFIHIVRDGAQVARSIERLATTNAYRLAGKGDFNQWWGAGGVKWRLLKRDGAALGRHPLDVEALKTHAERGAYEWLVSLHEVDRARERLAERLLEIRLVDLIEQPQEALTQVGAFAGVEPSRAWLDACGRMIDDSGARRPGVIALPDAVAAEFNAMQQRYGFAGKAVASDGAAPSPKQDRPRRPPAPNAARRYDAV